jgi:hypothetical protein
MLQTQPEFITVTKKSKHYSSKLKAEVPLKSIEDQCILSETLLFWMFTPSGLMSVRSKCSSKHRV